MTGVDMDYQLKQIENISANVETSSISQNSITLQQPQHQAEHNHVHMPSYSRISLASRAEQELVIDSKRKQFMFNSYENNNTKSSANASGYSINNLKGLRILNLSACTNISDNSLKHTLKMQELKELHLSACQKISIVGIVYLVEKCPSLEYLELSKCQNISDKCIELLTRKLNRLTHLYLANCCELSDYSIDSIAMNCKVLKCLDVNGCKLISIDPNLKLSHITSIQEIKYTQQESKPKEEHIFRLIKKMF